MSPELVSCQICFEKIDPGAPQNVRITNGRKFNAVKTLHCGHKFHHQCINRWIYFNDNCPYCRTPINDNEKQFNATVDPVPPNGRPTGFWRDGNATGYFYTSSSDPDMFEKAFTGDHKKQFETGERNIFFTKNGKLIMRKTPEVSLPEILYASKCGRLYDSLNIFFVKKNGVVLTKLT